MRVFLVTPVTVLTEEVDNEVIVIIGRGVSDDALLPGAFVELESSVVEVVDGGGVLDPEVDGSG